MKKLGIIIIIVSILLILTGIHDNIILRKKGRFVFERDPNTSLTKRIRKPLGNITIWGDDGYPIRLILLGVVLMIGGIILVKKKIIPTKICPYCAEKIKQKAIVCRYCGKELPKEKTKQM